MQCFRSALRALFIKADITPSPNVNCIDLDVSRAEKTGQLLLHSLARKKKKEETKAEEGEDEEFGDEDFFLTQM